MSDEPKPRKILKLAGGRPASLPPPPPPLHETGWRCKPCGHPVKAPDLTEENAQDPVRCEKCNARLGTVTDFNADPAPLSRLRVRPAKLQAPPAPPPPRPEGVVVVRRAPRPKPPVR